MRCKMLIALGVLLTLVGAAVILLLVIVWPNRAIIRNDSGEEVRDLQLVLYDFNNKVLMRRELARLAAGKSVCFRHDYCDLRAELQFVLAGTERKFKEPLIDLWRGEGWIFIILPDGTVKSGYDYPSINDESSSRRRGQRGATPGPR